MRSSLGPATGAQQDLQHSGSSKRALRLCQCAGRGCQNNAVRCRQCHLPQWSTVVSRSHQTPTEARSADCSDAPACSHDKNSPALSISARTLGLQRSHWPNHLSSGRRRLHLTKVMRTVAQGRKPRHQTIRTALSLNQMLQLPTTFEHRAHPFPRRSSSHFSRMQRDLED